MYEGLSLLTQTRKSLVFWMAEVDIARKCTHHTLRLIAAAA